MFTGNDSRSYHSICLISEEVNAWPGNALMAMNEHLTLYLVVLTFVELFSLKTNHLPHFFQIIQIHHVCFHVFWVAQPLHCQALVFELI